MIKKAFQDITLSRLGMGNMRLPLVDDKEGNPIDYPRAQEIIDYAYTHGVNYYDTAYVYHQQTSENFVGAALKKYPRESYYVATKFNYGANPDYKQVFQQQLDRLQMDYIDFYLCHAVMDANVDNYINCGCVDYFRQLKAEGKIKYLGFSSHATPEVLAKFADYIKPDFVQIQLNYYDWNFSRTKEEYEVLKSRNIPIMVMEPCRGGRLAKLHPDAEALLKAAHPDWSIASWAFRFVQSLDQTQVILSGMSVLDQVVDNVKTFSEYEFTAEDEAVLMKACEIHKAAYTVPCTGCHYCTDGCPMNIDIPAFITVYNNWKMNGGRALHAIDRVDSVGKPADCIQCGQCASHCPQSISIPEIMVEMAEAYNK